MKKYLLGLFAVVLAVGFSAFTKPAKVSDKQSQIVYLIYNGGTQTLISSYSQQLTLPATCTTTPNNLCWIEVVDPNNTPTSPYISQAEFFVAGSPATGLFTFFDTDADGTLNDEVETPELDKKQ